LLFSFHLNYNQIKKTVKFPDPRPGGIPYLWSLLNIPESGAYPLWIPGRVFLTDAFFSSIWKLKDAFSRPDGG